MKNSSSGPKYAVSAMPVERMYSSALAAMLRGSREYLSRVIVSITSQIRATVGCAGIGSITAVSMSGTSSMSDSWISWKPRRLDPSKPWPFWNRSSERPCGGIVKCCQRPKRSVTRRSMRLIPFASTSCCNSCRSKQGPQSRATATFARGRASLVVRSPRVARARDPRRSSRSL